jgi:DNA-binding MarR family transcriptional regulator
MGEERKENGGKRRAEIDFDLLPSLLGYNLRRAQVAVFQDFARALADCGITPGHFGVLVLIDSNPGLNQTALGNALGIDRSTVVAVIDRLEGRSLVERAVSPDDRRSYALRLTPAGTSMLAKAWPLVREHEARFARNLSKDEFSTLLNLLSRLAD